MNTKTATQTIVLEENDAHQTLEKFLKKLLPNAAL